jgi:hypothetical protein
MAFAIFGEALPDVRDNMIFDSSKAGGHRKDLQCKGVKP